VSVSLSPPVWFLLGELSIVAVVAVARILVPVLLGQRVRVL
jgi:hypothetical protein